MLSQKELKKKEAVQLMQKIVGLDRLAAEKEERAEETEEDRQRRKAEAEQLRLRVSPRKMRSSAKKSPRRTVSKERAVALIESVKHKDRNYVALGGNDRNLSVSGDSPDQQCAPQFDRGQSVPAQATEPEEPAGVDGVSPRNMRNCAVCAQMKPPEAFSKTQRRKGPKAKCMQCIQSGNRPQVKDMEEVQQPPPQKATDEGEVPDEESPLQEVPIEDAPVNDDASQEGPIEDATDGKSLFQEVPVEDARADDAESPLCLLYTSPSPRDQRGSRMPSSA